MKKKKIIIVTVTVLFLLLVLIVIFLSIIKRHHETIINLTDEEKLADYEYLCKILDQSYPFWVEVKEAGIEKEKIYENFKLEIVRTETDIEFMKTIKAFLNEFKGYGHLSVLDGYMYHYYDKTFSLGMEKLLTDYEKKKMQPLFETLQNPVSKKTYSMLDYSHLGFRSIKGLKDEYLNSETDIQATEIHNDNLEIRIIEDQKIAYIKIDSFEPKYIENDYLKLLDFYNIINSYENLIIDIQGNTGGSDIYWEDLIVAPNITETLSSDRYYLFNYSENNYISDYVQACFDNKSIYSTEKLPRLEKQNPSALGYLSNYIIDTTTIEPLNDIGFQGNIWVLTSDKVYSASENFVMICKNTGFATLVGTLTGGDGGVVDPILISLPNSGLIVRFSMFYGLNNDGSGNEAVGTLPDIEIGEGKDVLSECLLYINQK